MRSIEDSARPGLTHLGGARMDYTGSMSDYLAIGGDEGVRALVDRFYDIMDTDPQTEPIRRLHPTNLEDSRLKLYEFLCGWLGGPALYVQKRGHPRLRSRHMPFSIGISERDQWMRCMNQALSECVAEEEMRVQLSGAFTRLTDHMRNTAS